MADPVTQETLQEAFATALALIGKPKVVETDAGRIEMPSVMDALSAVQTGQTMLPVLAGTGTRRGWKPIGLNNLRGSV